MRNWFRAFRIERDESNMPVRLVWSGDYPRQSIQTLHYLACPRCGSKRVTNQRCLDCWWSATDVGEAQG